MSWLKPQFLCSFLLLISLQSFAQNTLSGRVNDVNNQAIGWVNVLVLNAADSLLFEGGISDQDGTFIFENIPNGSYLLQLSMIGFQDYYEPVELLNSNLYDFGAIVLSEDAVALDAVQVVAKKPLYEQKIDRMVVNVANSITSSGATALEVLQKSPGLAVNPQTNAISMSGRDGVVIMINGKISRLPMDALIQTLNGMSSDNIERIELIHTPPANFEAEGNAGFINIILKKSLEDGTNGSISLNGGYGRKEKLGGSFNINTRVAKLNVFADYSVNYNHSNQIFSNFRSFIDQDGFLQSVESDSDRDPTKLTVHNGRLGMDYQLTDKTIIGALGTWTGRYWTMDALNTISYLTDNVINQRIEVPNSEINNSNNFLANFNVEHRFTDDQKINFDIDYSSFNNNNPSDYTNRFFTPDGMLTSESQLRVSKETPMHILVSRLDYNNQISEKISFDVGVKYRAISFENDIAVEERVDQGPWEILPLFSSLSTLDEVILGTYGSLNYALGAHTDIKIGLRYERTDTELVTETGESLVDREYENVFPSLFLSQKINDNNSVQISYGKRINRPSFLQLAPFFIFTDPSTILTGNPRLQPSLSDNFRINYIWKTLQLGVQYALTDDPIGRFQPQVDKENNVQVNGAKNFMEAQNFSATLSFPITFTNWWTMRSSWTYQWNRFDDNVDGVALSFDQSSWYMNGAMSFTLPKDWSMELSGNYSSPSLYGSVTWQSFSRVDFGIQKNFSFGNIRFNIGDIFESAEWTGEIEEAGLDFDYRGFYGFAERNFKLSITKNFGSQSVKAARARETGSIEEQRRLN